MNRRLRLALASLVLAACSSTSNTPWEANTDPGADLVLLHGRIATMDTAHPTATALAVRGDRIVAVGGDAEIMQHVTERTRRIDLKGRFAMPGFIEGHGHFLGIGAMKQELDLRATTSWEEIVERVTDAAKRAKKGEWIVGRGWHQDKWTSVPQPNVEGVPLHDELSRATPDHPVLLVHASGHAAFVNEAALGLAGLSAETPNPRGGEIVKGVDGRPTGLLRETAEEFAWNARARTSKERDTFRKQVELATDECLSKGITSFQDAGTSLATLDRFAKLADEKALRLRLWMMARDDLDALRAGLAKHRWIARGGGFLTVRAIKEQIDGALGSHGAWLLAPYVDLAGKGGKPASAGLNTTELSMLEESARLAKENDLQLCIHAIGDRANREVLDLYERVLGKDAKTLDHRWRVEHAQHLDPADVPRFAHLGVIAAMQGVHCTSDGPWVASRLGEERAARTSYVWRSLLDSGCVIANGTDAPVEDVDPIASFAASVTRRMPNGAVFHAEQKMTREEALRSYTLAAAFAAHEDDVKGSLVVGKYADVVVLDQDLRTCPDEAITKTKVLYTIVGGKVAYEAK
ncbi:MAG: amidohydrolase [Planctomycetes bacterium]|nr:amidohydrolase [Planctomycetota bacterium]